DRHSGDDWLRRLSALIPAGGAAVGAFRSQRISERSVARVHDLYHSGAVSSFLILLPRCSGAVDLASDHVARAKISPVAARARQALNACEIAITFYQMYAGGWGVSSIVMAGLVPAIHVF